jgi:hypothetical protein
MEVPTISKAQKAGATSLRAIRDVLNDRWIPTPADLGTDAVKNPRFVTEPQAQ